LAFDEDNAIKDENTSEVNKVFTELNIFSSCPKDSSSYRGEWSIRLRLCSGR